MLFVFINGSLLSVRFMSVLENGTNPSIVLRISFMRWHAIILFLQLNFAECQGGSRFRPLSTTDNIFSKLSQMGNSTVTSDDVSLDTLVTTLKSISDSVAHLTKEVNAFQRPCMADNDAMTRLNKQPNSWAYQLMQCLFKWRRVGTISLRLYWGPRRGWPEGIKRVFPQYSRCGRTAKCRHGQSNQ